LFTGVYKAFPVVVRVCGLFLKSDAPWFSFQCVGCDIDQFLLFLTFLSGPFRLLRAECCLATEKYGEKCSGQILFPDF
jgi:hypothetical protein